MSFTRAVIAALLATGGPGSRHIEITSPASHIPAENEIDFYSGNATELSPAYLRQRFDGAFILQTGQLAGQPTPPSLELVAVAGAPGVIEFSDGIVQSGLLNLAGVQEASGHGHVVGELGLGQLELKAKSVAQLIVGGSGGYTVFFDTPFPNAAFACIVSHGNNAESAGQEICSLAGLTLASLSVNFYNPRTNVYPAAGLTRTTDFIAIGC